MSDVESLHREEHTRYFWWLMNIEDMYDKQSSHNQGGSVLGSGHHHSPTWRPGENYNSLWWICTHIHTYIHIYFTHTHTHTLHIHTYIYIYTHFSKIPRLHQIFQNILILSYYLLHIYHLSDIGNGHRVHPTTARRGHIFTLQLSSINLFKPALQRCARVYMRDK